MNEQNALAIIKQVIDLSVQKGLFGGADDVVAVSTAYKIVAAKIEGLEKVTPKPEKEKVD